MAGFTRSRSGIGCFLWEVASDFGELGVRTWSLELGEYWIGVVVLECAAVVNGGLMLHARRCFGQLHVSQ